jgi:DNA-binding Lrp family transcriptional regulator
MGAAVWEFMWLIDKVTRIDINGVGYVLGGKPIKLEDIADDMKVHRDTVSINLKTLETEGYITRTHAPYGLVIKVINAKKRFGKNTEPAKQRLRENTEPLRENTEPAIGKTPNLIRQYNKTIQIDITIPDFINKESWKDWVEYRKEIKKRMTPLTAKKQWSLLSRYSPEEQKQIIDKSITNGWTGIFDLAGAKKVERNPNNNKFNEVKETVCQV